VIVLYVLEFTVMKKRRRAKSKRPPFPLRELLAKYDYSQRKLAKASGIDLGTINALAAGRNLPSWPTILRIATTIGADLGDLVPGKDGVA
jgi:transcriptional regulator with XRE-family HTH domain